jgi:hypothetical protein
MPASLSFVSERGPFTRDGFAKLLKAAADRAGIENVHPHALRHACGHALAMKGRDAKLIQDYLGHRNIQHTSLYTDGVSTKFKRHLGLRSTSAFPTSGGSPSMFWRTVAPTRHSVGLHTQLCPHNPGRLAVGSRNQA